MVSRRGATLCSSTVICSTAFGAFPILWRCRHTSARATLTPSPGLSVSRHNLSLHTSRTLQTATTIPRLSARISVRLATTGCEWTLCGGLALHIRIPVRLQVADIFRFSRGRDERCGRCRDSHCEPGSPNISEAGELSGVAAVRIFCFLRRHFPILEKRRKARDQARAAPVGQISPKPLSGDERGRPHADQKV